MFRGYTQVQEIPAPGLNCIDVTCYLQPAIGGSEICCGSCSEIFQFTDEDGNYIIKKSSMPSTKARYAPGGGVAFWQLTPTGHCSRQKIWRTSGCRDRILPIQKSAAAGRLAA